MKRLRTLWLPSFIVLVAVVVLLPTWRQGQPVAAAAPDTEPRPAVPGAAGPVTLLAVADATLKSGFPNANFGAADTLDLGYVGGGRNIDRMLLRFDLAAGLPSGAVIDSAQLQVRLNSGTGVSPISVRASTVTAAWSELSLNFAP
jgi:hypothetical protein